MKRQFTNIVLAAGLTVIGSLALSAQDRTEVADIPFSFVANHVNLPAGTYQIQRHASGVFQLSDADRHSIFMNAPVPTTGKIDDAHVTFACYGGKCLLAQIALPDGMTYSVSGSALDKEREHGMDVAAMISVKLHR